MPKHFMRIRDLGHAGAWALLDRARRISRTPDHGSCLAGKTAVLVCARACPPFFEAAVRKLGGRVVPAAFPEDQEDQAEALEDTARALAAGADLLIGSARSRGRLERLAAGSRLPVLNAGDEEGDPCRVLADLLLLLERGEDLARTRVAWIGAANGMAASWIEASMYFPLELFMAVPPGREPDRALLGLALQAGAKIFLTYDPRMAAQGAGYLCLNVAETPSSFVPPSDLAALAAPGALLLEGPDVSGQGGADPDPGGLSRVSGADESRLALTEALLEWLVS